MAAEDARTILRIPGRLSYGATDLTTAWPHGGTGLGSIRSVHLLRQSAAYPVTIEALGGEPVEYLEPGEVWGLGAVLRTWQDDVLSTLFPSTSLSTGTTTQRKILGVPGTTKAGTWMSARAVKLVFTPDGAGHAKSATAPDVRAPFVVLYRAVPLVREQQEMALEHHTEWGIPVLFMGIRDSSARILAMGHRSDLTL